MKGVIKRNGLGINLRSDRRSVCVKVAGGGWSLEDPCFCRLLIKKAVIGVCQAWSGIE